MKCRATCSRWWPCLADSVSVLLAFPVAPTPCSAPRVSLVPGAPWPPLLLARMALGLITILTRPRPPRIIELPILECGTYPRLPCNTRKWRKSPLDRDRRFCHYASYEFESKNNGVLRSGNVDGRTCESSGTAGNRTRHVPR